MNGAQRQLTRSPRSSGIYPLAHELQLRDAYRLRQRHALRTLACRITERYGKVFSSLGVSGVCSFIGAFGCFRFGLCSSVTYVVAALASLFALVVSLTIAMLGDPYELARRRARLLR